MTTGLFLALLGAAVVAAGVLATLHDKLQVRRAVQEVGVEEGRAHCLDALSGAQCPPAQVRALVEVLLDQSKQLFVGQAGGEGHALILARPFRRLKRGADYGATVSGTRGIVGQPPSGPSSCMV